jgi:SDR family mycofactocin-dependent oxidoreductase
MEQLQGEVAFVTGGARGQGRSHVLALAKAGADIATCDIAADIDTVPYSLATAADLAETQALVEGLGRRCLTFTADVRDTAQLQDGVDRTIGEYGKIDICVANAGICGFGKFWEITDSMWDDMIGTDLTGVFKTLRAVVPHMIERGEGRIVAISSMGGKMGNPNLAHYVAAKWGVIGLVKTLALEVAESGITVNAICPATVNTGMVHNPAMYELFCPDLDNPTIDQVRPLYQQMSPMRVPWVEVSDISDAVLFLASPASKFISGSTIDISTGGSALMP